MSAKSFNENDDKIQISKKPIETTSLDEDTTQSRLSYNTESQTTSSDNNNNKGYIGLHTPQILTSIEVVEVENSEREANGDTMCQIFVQSFLPFFIGGIGSILAGLLLTFSNKKLDLIADVPEFLILMPPLQGLKGNLDMTFSARLSTLAHIGAFDSPGIKDKVFRSAAVIEAQSIFVCIIANLVSLLMVLSERRGNYWNNFLFLGSSSIVSMAANFAVSTLLLSLLVRYTWRKKLNPDNIVTPLGASFGDLLTIFSMLLICYAIRPYSQFSNWIPGSIVIIALLCAPMWVFIASKDNTILKYAKQQCITLVFASALSCIAGFIQQNAAGTYVNYPAYQTLISGLTGNRCAVQASRISSYLEVNGKSELYWEERLSPISYFRSPCKESKTARLLLFTSLPFQLFFVLISTLISIATQSPVEDSAAFFIGYSIAVSIQVFIIMYFTQLLVIFLWRMGFDPDIHAIPLLTSTADVCGCLLLHLLFVVLGRLGYVRTKNSKDM